MNDRLLISFDNHVAHVRLNRPDKLNAIDMGMLEALNDAPRRLAELEDLRAVVLSGAGRSFCAGLDFESFVGAPELLHRVFDPVAGKPANFVQHAALCWRWVDVPVIAAIDGHCFGGGLQIALGADIRIASPDARMSVMEIRWGLVPDMGATQTLREVTSLDVAKELTLSGRILDAQEANDLGLVTRVAEYAPAAALELAGEIAARSPDAVVAAKRLFNDAWAASFADGLALEARAQQGVLGRPNQIEAVRANMERRDGVFHKAKNRKNS